MDKSPISAQSVRKDVQPARKSLQTDFQHSDIQPNRLARTSNKRLKKSLIIVIVVVLILLLSLVGYLTMRQLNTVQPDKNAYQAVFLSNGQVYFGKLDNVSGNYVQMSNIYYLQAKQDLQATSGQPQDAAALKNQTSGMQLIKLGDELHGPTDEMHIKGSQVLFWEDLKPNGKVAEAIAAYKK